MLDINNGLPLWCHMNFITQGKRFSFPIPETLAISSASSFETFESEHVQLCWSCAAALAFTEKVYKHAEYLKEPRTCVGSKKSGLLCPFSSLLQRVILVVPF